MLFKNGANLEIKDQDCYSALMLAVIKNEIELCKYFLKYSANIETRDNNGLTPIMKASSKGYLEICKLLLNYGANVNSSDNDGCTPLMYSLAFNNYDIAKLLLENGADPNQREKKGISPLNLTIIDNNKCIDDIKKICKLLFDHEADINTKLNVIPLLLITTYIKPELIDFLVENGANVNIKSKDNRTVLMAAIIRKCDLNKIKFLIEHDVDINAKDNDGKTALTYAKENNLNEIVEYLIEIGAKE